MKKLVTVSLMVLSILASISCGGQGNASSTEEKEYDDNLSYIQRNGDVYQYLNNSNAEYSELTRDTSAAELVSKVKNKESCFVYIYQTSCAHCISFKPVLFRFIKDYFPEVYSFRVSQLSDFNFILSSFPNYTSAFQDIGTPSIFFFKDESTCTKVTNLNDYITSKSFNTYISKNYNLLKTISVRSYAGFTKTIENNKGLIYLDKDIENEYTGSLFPLVKQYKKSLIRIEYNYLSAEDKTQIDNLFGNSKFLLKENELTPFNYDVNSSEVQNYFKS